MLFFDKQTKLRLQEFFFFLFLSVSSSDSHSTGRWWYLWVYVCMSYVLPIVRMCLVSFIFLIFIFFSSSFQFSTHHNHIDANDLFTLTHKINIKEIDFHLISLFARELSCDDKKRPQQQQRKICTHKYIYIHDTNEWQRMGPSVLYEIPKVDDRHLSQSDDVRFSVLFIIFFPPNCRNKKTPNFREIISVLLFCVVDRIEMIEYAHTHTERRRRRRRTRRSEKKKTKKKFCCTRERSDWNVSVIPLKYVQQLNVFVTMAQASIPNFVEIYRSVSVWLIVCNWQRLPLEPMVCAFSSGCADACPCVRANRYEVRHTHMGRETHTQTEKRQYGRSTRYDLFERICRLRHFRIDRIVSFNWKRRQRRHTQTHILCSRFTCSYAEHSCSNT